MLEFQTRHSFQNTHRWKTDKCIAKGLIDAVWSGEDPGNVTPANAKAGQSSAESSRL